MDECNTQEELPSVKFMGGGETERLDSYCHGAIMWWLVKEFYCNFPQQSGPLPLNVIL